MNQPLIEKPEHRTSAVFREMADSIDHNKGQGFGGAVVIVPPEGGGEAISLLLLDSSADLAQFYSNIKTRIDIRLEEIRRKGDIAGGYR